MYFYTDAKTRGVLLQPGPAVLLYGGYEGFDNFGDILQLKGAISFHRRSSSMPIVMVVSLAAWTTPDLLERLADHFEVDGFIFEDGELLDASEHGLAPIEQLDAGNLLHVYGGGYFNSYWGARRAFVVEQLMFGLHVRDWVISGVQVDAEGAAHLQRVFALKMPLLVGARDESSVALLSDIVPAERLRNSFDDALEPLAALAAAFTRTAQIASGTRRSIGVHLNITSEYMEPTQLATGRDLITRAIAKYPLHEATVLHAYNDSRNLALDSLESVARLDLSIFAQFDVINFASVASTPTLEPTVTRQIARCLADVDFVITASYHIALALNLFGKPTFLLATSGFYDDKRVALGLTDDFDAFLAAPGSFLRDFAAEKRAREDWLAALGDVVATFTSEGWTERVSIPSPDAAPEATVSERYSRL